MGKNDVEILLKAKDATAPGVDAANKKLKQLRDVQDKADFAAYVRAERNAEKTAAAQLRAAQRVAAEQDKAALLAQSKAENNADKLVGYTIKLGAAVAGLQGAFGLATAAVAFFRGDTDQVVESLKRLPLGIGGVVSSLDTFIQYVSGTADEMERLKAAAAATEETINRGFKLDGVRRSLKDRAALETAPNEFERQRLEALQEREKMQADLLAAGGKLGGADEDAINKITVARLDKVEAARQKAFASELAAEKKRQDELNKLRDESAGKEQKRLARLFGGTGPGGSLFGDARMDAVMSADERAIQSALAAARGGGSGGGLASGEQSRFLTGLTASARESQARVQNDQLNVQKQMLDKLENIADELKEANKPADPSTQLNLTVGALGGLS